MKLLNTKTFAALAIAGAMSFGNAFAMNTRSMSVDSVVGVNSADLRITVDGGVATLFGNVESGAESALAKAYVKNLDGIDNVINQILIN